MKKALVGTKPLENLFRRDSNLIIAHLINLSRPNLCLKNKYCPTAFGW